MYLSKRLFVLNHTEIFLQETVRGMIYPFSINSQDRLDRSEIFRYCSRPEVSQAAGRPLACPTHKRGPWPPRSLSYRDSSYPCRAGPVDLFCRRQAWATTERSCGHFPPHKKKDPFGSQCH